jgi:putative transposase
MPRSARIVIPNVAHHVTQRGNRQQKIFFSDDDYRAYRTILGIGLKKHNTRCLAYCLMPNHVHLMLVPEGIDGLRATLSAVHTAYAQRINTAQKASGHLFQGRFASYPMDDPHMMVAARYIENNPVKAGMVLRAEDWAWSSARSHISGTHDGITESAPLTQYIKNWRAMLAHGLEAADHIDAALQTGRPLATGDWIKAHGLMIAEKKRGRPRSN